MILHFVIDEKVTDQIIENFSKADDSCCFLVFLSGKEEPLNYIKSFSDRIIKFSLQEDINAILEELNVKAILTHAFHLEYAKAILKIKRKIKIGWYIWGFDVYGLPKIKPYTYAPLTNEYLLSSVPKLRIGRILLKYQFLRKFFFFFSKEEDRYTVIFKALKKVDYFITYLEDDYKFFSKYYNNSFRYINCPFSTIDQYLAGNQNICLHNNANNILIGNSNSIESNHIDALSHISKHIDKENNVSVYIPLSYGDNQDYKSYILKSGKKLFGDNFNPLLNFMERKHYIGLLRSCSVGVFYHYRQQAMGNIIAMLYLGSRVYLSKRNPAFNFFIENNIKVFDLENDFRIYQNSKLEAQEVSNNRKVLAEIFNESRVLKEIEQLNSILI